MIWRRARAKVEVRLCHGHNPGSRGEIVRLKKGIAVGFEKNIHGMYLEGIIEEIDDYMQQSIGWY